MFERYLVAHTLFTHCVISQYTHTIIVYVVNNSYFSHTSQSHTGFHTIVTHTIAWSFLYLLFTKCIITIPYIFSQLITITIQSVPHYITHVISRPFTVISFSVSLYYHNIAKCNLLHSNSYGRNQHYT